MTYLEVLIESFEDTTENRLPNGASWEQRWCGLLPWAAAACQGHGKMVMSSSLALPLPVPGEIRVAAGARAGMGVSVCRLGPAASRDRCPCPASSLLTAGAACRELCPGLRACFPWWTCAIGGGFFKSWKICTLCEQGQSLCYVPATRLWCSLAPHPPLFSQMDFDWMPGISMMASDDGVWSSDSSAVNTG